MTWTYCRRCGGINEPDAERCYLCASSDLLHSCPHCSADFRNPLDSFCRSCGQPYKEDPSREGTTSDETTKSPTGRQPNGREGSGEHIGQRSG